MNWQEELISLYFFICKQFDEELSLYNQRFSKNADSLELKFTDEEAVTVYLWGIRKGFREVSKIHTYIKDHLLEWFPYLPSYPKLNERLNRLNDLLAHLVVRMIHITPFPEYLLSIQGKLDAVVDSMPIILAKGNRADGAKVAREVANKGFCSTKNLWFHGLRLHFLGIFVPQKLPVPFQLALSEASENDNTFFKEQLAPFLSNIRVFGDRIYHDEGAQNGLALLYNIEMCPVNKRKKGQTNLFYDQKLLNTEISRVRQPVESFFNWLINHSGIQCASKVRSTKGLFKHIWGRTAAAILSLIHIF